MCIYKVYYNPFSQQKTCSTGADFMLVLALHFYTFQSFTCGKFPCIFLKPFHFGWYKLKCRLKIAPCIRSIFYDSFWSILQRYFNVLRLLILDSSQTKILKCTDIYGYHNIWWNSLFNSIGATWSQEKSSHLSFLIYIFLIDNTGLKESSPSTCPTMSWWMPSNKLPENNGYGLC